MKNKITSHKQLLVWQKAMDLVDLIYKITQNFPKEELYGLTSQMKRSVVSIPSNVAEGRVRTGEKEFIHFLYIALGSASELDTQLEVAKRQGLLSETRYTETIELLNEVGRMLSGLITSLKTSR